MIWYIGFDCGRSAGSGQRSNLCGHGKRILVGGGEERNNERKENTETTDIKKEEVGVGSIGQGNKQKIVGL
jgi:hypothetical protein